MRCFIFHEWGWQGAGKCTCSKCGATRHSYYTPGLGKHKCSRCKEPNPDKTVHDLRKVGFDACQCKVCGFYFHDWDGCICKTCHQVRYNTSVGHDLRGCICQKCGWEFHKFGSTLHRDKECNYFKQCENCQKTEIVDKAKHDYQRRYDLEKTRCQNYLVCKDCGYVLVKETHDFKFARFGDYSEGPEEGSFTSSKWYKCTKCGKEEERTDWSDKSSRDW